MLAIFRNQPAFLNFFTSSVTIFHIEALAGLRATQKFKQFNIHKPSPPELKRNSVFPPPQLKQHQREQALAIASPLILAAQQAI